MKEFLKTVVKSPCMLYNKTIEIKQAILRVVLRIFLQIWFQMKGESIMFKYNIRGENIEVTEAIRQYAEKKISKLEKILY